MSVACHTEESVRRFPLFFFTVLLLFASCADQPQDGNTVARVNGTVLTMEMIRDGVDTSRSLTQSDIQQYANRWVIGELLYQEAQLRGYESSEQIQKKVAEAKKQLSIAEMLEKEVYALAAGSIREDEIAAYYQSHTAEFTLKEDIIRLSVSVFRELEPANRFRAEVLGGKGWLSAVSQFRNDPLQEMMSFSDSVFYTQSALYPPELWKVATVLGMHETSFPVKTSAGYFVLRSMGKYQSSAIAPLHYVLPEIRDRLAMERRQQRYQQFLNELRTKHTVQVMVDAQ